MLNAKEITSIAVITIILGLMVSFFKGLNKFLIVLLIMFVIIIVNVLAKKIASYYFEAEAEIRIWEIERYGYRLHEKFKKPVAAGIFLPIIITLLTFGHIKWMATLVFDIKGKTYRAAKRHGIYNFSEMTESQIGVIAAFGIIANLIVAIIAYLIGEQEFVKYSIFYTFFNMIPISDLDGNKIFFGNIVLWSTLASIVLIGLTYVFFVY